MPKDYSDFFQVKWIASTPPLTFKSFMVKRIPFIFLFYTAVVIASSKLVTQQSIVSHQILFWTNIILGSIALLVIEIIDYNISKHMQLKINYYQISKEGIYYNQRCIPYSYLSYATCQKIIKSIDEYLTPKLSQYEFTLPLKIGSVKLLFPDKETFHQFATSLKKYYLKD